jgi:D-hydroxyproline dehydrogenase subunit beta
VNGNRDVVVVGAGIVGSATAYYLAKGGASVRVLDGRHPAWGASGRNPGYVWLHTRAEGTQMSLALAGRRLYDDLVEELDDFEFRRSGGMIFFFDDQAELFPQFVENRRAAGLPMELLGPGDAREACAILPEDVGGATFSPLDAHLNPEKLVRAFAAAAERLGAQFVPGTQVQGLEVRGGRCVGVKTPDGVLAANTVVVAAGSWSPKLLEPLGLPLPIVPMRLQMAETEPIDISFSPVLYGPTGVKQYALTKDIPGYSQELFTHPLETVLPGLELLELAAQRRDGSVMLGCPMDFVGYDDRPTVGGMALTCGVLADHLPALKDVAIKRTWAGLLPQTPDALPILGPIEAIDGLALAAGHVFGVAAGPVSGKVVAQQILGQTPEVDLSPFRYERKTVTDALEAHRQW